MADIQIPWDKITRGLPRGRKYADDRAPTLEEIKKLCEYPDRRIKPLAYTMASSGIRVGAWAYFRWGNILPIEKDGKIVAARLLVYAGEEGSYVTYITPSAYRELAEWMKYREESGEIITADSWVMRDLWDRRVKISRGLITIPKKLTAIGVKRLMERAMWAQGLRNELQPGKKRRFAVQGETKIIRYGAIPLARNAICIIDEIGAMSYDDQVSLFNVMEHGEFPLNKHGESKTVPAPTTIIGTSNPKNINASWANSAKASKDEIPLRRALIDRFDIVLIFTDEDTAESAHDYASKKMLLNKRHVHNYKFLQKYLNYIRSATTEITFTKDAEVMVTNYFASLKVNKNLALTNRALDILTRICQAWARLHLQNEVDAETVGQVQTFFSSIMLQYGEVVKAVVDPREIACDQIIEVIKQTEDPISFEEAARLACNQNQVVRDYVGPNTKLRENNKLHDISERVRQYSNIRTIRLKPLVLEWIKTKEHNDGISKQTSQDSGNKGNDNYDQRKDAEKGNVV